MILKNISSSVRDKLDTLIPDWESLVDKDALQKSYDDGTFDETWLAVHLKEQFRVLVKSELEERGKEVASQVHDGAGKSASTALDEFRAFALETAKRFSKVEEGISQIIMEYFWEKLGKNSDDVRENLRDSVGNLKRDIEEKSKAYEAEISRLFGGAMDLIKKFNNKSEDKGFRSIFERQLEKFKQENKRAIAAQQKFLDGSFSVFLDQKASDLGRGITLVRDNNDFPEKRNLAVELEEMVKLEVQKQRDLRTESVNAILSKAIGKSGSRALGSFLDGFSDLSPYNKKILKAVINSGYLFLEDEEDDFVFKKASIENKKSSTKVPTISKLYEIAKELNWIQEQNQEELDAIYNDSVYKFCNGGWWSTLAHLGTAGFCSGWTLAANLHSLILGRMLDMKGLILVVDTIIFFVALPYRITADAFAETSTISDLVTASTVEEIRKKVIFKVKRDSRVAFKKLLVTKKNKSKLS